MPSTLTTQNKFKPPTLVMLWPHVKKRDTEVFKTKKKKENIL